jgi:hypothetical protein
MNWSLVGRRASRVGRRALVFAGGIAVIAGAAQLFAPQTVHGLVSALVTVNNTASNPVPVSGSVAAVNATSGGVTQPLIVHEDSRGSDQPFSLALSCTNFSNGDCTPGTLIAPPIGKALAINDVSGRCVAGAGADGGELRLTLASGTSIHIPFTSSFSLSGQTYLYFGRTVSAVVGPTETASLVAEFEVEPYSSCDLTVSGYAVNP